jgi:hypothetical protein
MTMISKDFHNTSKYIAELDGWIEPKLDSQAIKTRAIAPHAKKRYLLKPFPSERLSITPMTIEPIIIF